MSQLRRRPGSIVGRSDDVRAVRTALERSALVTLLGPGGVGKTALAAEVMNEVEPDFERLVPVELAEARDEADVVRLLAAALGIAGTADLDRVTTELAAVGAMVLVVIDNCEQVVDEVSRVVGALLGIGPSISVLATSRRPLEVGDEVTWPVRPLPLPDDPALLAGSAGNDSNDRALTGSGAVQLFLERVRQAVPSFELTPANRELVARICAAADGLPLTLELAAALVRSRPLDEILVALNQRPADLVAGRRDRPEHQRSIGASLDWSRRFLDPDDAGLLDRLSIFVGGFTSEAARHVDPAGTADGLARLVDHSLIDFDREAGRYRILEIVRLDAERRLTDDDRTELRRRHLRFCLTVVAALDEAKSEPDPDNLFPRFEHELGNLGAAARWALAEGDVDGFRSLVGPIAVWWVHYLAPDDPERWEHLFTAEADADADADVPAGWLANVVSALGFHWSHRGDHRRSIEYGRRAVELHAAVDDHDAQTLDEVSIGNAFLALGNRDEARAAYDRGALAAARSGRPYSKLAVLVSQVRLDPDGPETPARLAEARSLAEVGFGAIEAAVVVETGLLRLRSDDRDGARRLVDEGLAMAEANGYAEVVAAALSARAELAEVDGEIDRAVRLHRRALALGRRQMHWGVIDRAESELSRLAEVDSLGPSRGSAADGGLGSPAGPADRSELELSERELSVARLLRGDLTQREIADELYIAPSTVKTHIKSIYRKLEVSKRSHAVTRAAELGLFD